METPFEKPSGKRNAVALKREFNLAKQRGQVRTVKADRAAQVVAEFQAKARKRMAEIQR